MDNTKHRRLQELDRSDFEVAKGQPDIRGWDVKNIQGQKLGEVEELIVDAQERKVRYMVVDLDDNELRLDHRKVLIPIGLAELHKENDDVILPSVQPQQLRDLPDYHRNHLESEIERKVCTVLGRTTDRQNKLVPESDQELYQHDYFNDDNLYKQRLSEADKRKQMEQSDYEKGLRLWERRSEGGILPDTYSKERVTGSNNRRMSDGNQGYHEREIEERARMQMIRDRRNSYEQRTYRNQNDRSGNQYFRQDSVEKRIRDEGLRDPDDL